MADSTLQSRTPLPGFFVKTDVRYDIIFRVARGQHVHPGVGGHEKGRPMWKRPSSDEVSPER